MVLDSLYEYGIWYPKRSSNDVGLGRGTLLRNSEDGVQGGPHGRSTLSVPSSIATMTLGSGCGE